MVKYTKFLKVLNLHNLPVLWKLVKRKKNQIQTHFQKIILIHVEIHILSNEFTQFTLIYEIERNSIENSIFFCLKKTKIQ